MRASRRKPARRRRRPRDGTPDGPAPDSDPSATADEESTDASTADVANDVAPALPSLRFDIADGVLTVDGELSSADNPAVLIESAMDSFDLDFVSNAVETRDGVAEAGWLGPLVSLLPTLARLDAPGVEVSESRVTLRGEAADSVVRDEVVEDALEELGDYSVIERIVIRDPPDAATGTSDAAVAESDDTRAATERADDEASAGATGERVGSAEGGRDCGHRGGRRSGRHRGG